MRYLLPSGFYALLAAIVVAMFSAPALADMNYQFVKFECDENLKSVTIETFWDWNETGEQTAKHLPKNTYELEKLPKLRCNIQNVTVSVKGYFDGLPKNDAIEIFIHGQKEKILRINGDELASTKTTIAKVHGQNMFSIMQCIDHCQNPDDDFVCEYDKRTHVNKELCTISGYNPNS